MLPRYVTGYIIVMGCGLSPCCRAMCRRDIDIASSNPCVVRMVLCHWLAIHMPCQNYHTLSCVVLVYSLGYNLCIHSQDTEYDLIVCRTFSATCMRHLVGFTPCPALLIGCCSTWQRTCQLEQAIKGTINVFGPIWIINETEAFMFTGFPIVVG